MNLDNIERYMVVGLNSRQTFTADIAEARAAVQAALSAAYVITTAVVSPSRCLVIVLREPK